MTDMDTEKCFETKTTAGFIGFQNVDFLFSWLFRMLSTFLLLLILLLISNSVLAAPAAVVGKGADGSYNLYCYEELLDSYALKLLGNSNGLYESYAVNKLVALFCCDNGYFDYADILKQYQKSIQKDHQFNLSSYIQSNTAQIALLPDILTMVTIESENLIYQELYIGQSDIVADLPASEKKHDPEPALNETPIKGSAKVSLDDAQKWAESKGAHQRFIDIAPMYWQYGAVTGIRPEVLYAQSAHETHYGKFTGIVPASFNNWAGIKVGDSNGDEVEDHQAFYTPEDGVRAHFNHISAYVGLKPVGEPHDRYFVVLRLPWAGTVRMVEELSGKWAPSETYHLRIVSMIDEMKP